MFHIDNKLKLLIVLAIVVLVVGIVLWGAGIGIMKKGKDSGNEDDKKKGKILLIVGIALTIFAAMMGFAFYSNAWK